MKVTFELNDTQVEQLNQLRGNQSTADYLSARFQTSVFTQKNEPSWLSGLSEFDKELDNI